MHLSSVSTPFYRPVTFKHSPEHFFAKHPQSVLFNDSASPVNYKGIKVKKGKVFPAHAKKAHTRNPEARLHTFLNLALVNYEAFNYAITYINFPLSSKHSR
jgi:hypothetical protein